MKMETLGLRHSDKPALIPDDGPMTIVSTLSPSLSARAIIPNSSKVIVSVTKDGEVSIDWAAAEDAAKTGHHETYSFFATVLLAVRNGTARNVG